MAKYTNDRHLIWHEARTSLKNEIIRSLGPTLASTIGPPPTGFTTITVPQIVAAVKGFYGTIDQLALNRMEDTLAGPLDSVGNLDKHLANMRQHMLMQTTTGYPIEEHRKVRIVPLPIKTLLFIGTLNPLWLRRRLTRPQFSAYHRY